MGRTSCLIAGAMTVLLVSASGMSPAVGAAVGGGPEWPQFHDGFTHAGASPAVGPSSATVSWTLPPSGPYVDYGTSPAVGPNGTVYVLEGSGNDERSRLEAISPTTHKPLWTWTDTKQVGGAFRSTPAAGPHGTVYVVTDATPGNNDLVAIGKGGTTTWTLSGLELFGPPTIGPDGTLYVETADSELYAVDPQDGSIYWSFAGTPGAIGAGGTAAVSPDGTTVYLASSGGDLYALAAGPSGGSLTWTYQIQLPQGGYISNAPAVGPDGTIYVETAGKNGSSPADIVAVNPDGTLKWAHKSNASFGATPTVTAAGQIVAGNDDGTVVALTQSSGKVAWKYAAPGTVSESGFGNSSPASDSNGDVYIMDQEDVFALSPTGSLLWKSSVEAPSYGASPALSTDGTLYVTGGNEALVAFGS